MTAPARPAAAPDARAKAIAALVFGVLCIGIGPTFVKIASREVASEVIAFYRLLIASLLLTPAAIHRLRNGASCNRPSLPVTLLAGLFFAVNIAMWNFALAMTTAANVTLLDNTAPVWVGLLTLFLFRRRLPSSYWFGLALALAGAILIISGGMGFSSDTLPGDTLALAAGVIYAFYLLAAEVARRGVDSVIFVWIFSSVGMLLLLAFSLLRGSPLAGFSFVSLAAILGLGLISHLGGWLSITHALGVLPASTVSVLLLGQPVIATLLAIPFFNEIPSSVSFIGGAITLFGIATVLKGVNQDE